MGKIYQFLASKGMVLKKMMGVIAFVLFLLFSAITIGSYLYYRYLNTTLLPQINATLQKVAQERAGQINEFMRQQEQHLEELAALPKLADSLTQHSQLLKKKEAKSAAYDKQLEALSSTMKGYKQEFGLKNILLIDTDGVIVFSETPKTIISTSLHDETYKKSSLAYSFARVMMSMAIDIADFSFDPLTKAPALFLSSPVFQNKRVVGVLTVQLDEDKVYRIIRNYKGLGKTGEVVLGKMLNTDALLIAPTRMHKDAAFKKNIPLSSAATPFDDALIGEKGSGLRTSYDGKPVVASWLYLPDVAWGLNITLNVEEALASITRARLLFYALLFLALALLTLLVFTYSTLLADKLKKIPFLQKSLTTLKAVLTVRTVLLILFLISFGSILISIYQFRRSRRSVLKSMQQSATSQAHDAAKKMNEQLESVVILGHAIAHDLTTGHLRKEDLSIRLKRAVKEHGRLFGITIAYAPHAFSKEKKLHAPYVTQEGGVIEEHDLTSFYDYTQKAGRRGTRAPWYGRALEKGAHWSSPTIEPLRQKDVIIYSVPFYAIGTTDKKKPAGVVALFYELRHTYTFAERVSLGQTGYAFILSKQGIFVRHPVNSYVKDKRSIFDIAAEQGSEELHHIAQEALGGKRVLTSYVDGTTQQTTWLYFAHVPSLDWLIGTTFTDQEVTPTIDVARRQTARVLLSCVITLILLTFLLFRIEVATLPMLLNCAITLSLILSAGLSTLWYVIKTHSSESPGNRIVIAESISLDKFMEKIIQRSAIKNEPPPMTLPTGLFISSFSFPTPSQVSFAGDIWQKINRRKYPEATHGIEIPQATEVTMTETFRKTEGEDEIVGWNVSATVAQKFRHADYPFDAKQLEIPLEYHDQTQHTLLVPDLAGYPSTKPEATPGIPSQFNIPEFSIDSTFYSFEPKKAETNFGLRSYQEITDRVDLRYNMILTRNILNAFVVFLLPLLVILFSIFAIFSILQKDPQSMFRTLSAYTGVFLALIFLQRNLRAQFPTGEVLYIEYFFFSTYLTILLLTLHALYAFTRPTLTKAYERGVSLMRIFFWPCQLLVWFVITIVMFY